MPKSPKLCRQGNLAYVRVHGRKIYLGTFGSAEAEREYHRVIAQFHANAAEPPRDKSSITLDELCLRFLEDRKGKTTSSQWGNYKSLIEILVGHYSGLPACKFSPNKLRTVQAEFVKLGFVRQQCNRRVSLIRSVFKWGVSREMVAPDIWNALRCVEPLRKGETTAPEGKKREVIPPEHIERTLAELSPTIATMVRIHLATAARPGEICGLMIEHIDRSNSNIWVVRQSEHKNDWREDSGEKIMYLGKPEIELLTPIIGDRVEGYVFRPQDALAEHKAKKWAQAKSKKKTPSREARDAKRAEVPRVRVKEHYSVEVYRKAIERACQRAGVKHWFPYALRHTAITDIGTEFGIESAQHVAGHKDLRTTLGYFHGENAVARAVVEKRNEQIIQSATNTPTIAPVERMPEDTNNSQTVSNDWRADWL